MNKWSIHGIDGRTQILNFAISIADIFNALEVEIPLQVSIFKRCGNLKQNIDNFL